MTNLGEAPYCLLLPRQYLLSEEQQAVGFFGQLTNIVSMLRVKVIV